MLKPLYEYGIRNELVIPPGFIQKPIKAYISLSKNGKFLGIEQYGKDEIQVCPDIGSLANSPDKCNPIAEKMSVILADSGKKSEYFRMLLKEGKESAEILGVCLDALENPETFESILQEAQLRKIKAADRMSFLVDGFPVVADSQVKQWWKEYRKCLSDKSDVPFSRCLITGEQTIPLATLPVINGLQAVGGHSRGEALFCFDKSSFQSYGLKQSANAPVSEEAFAVVKEAMNDLLAGAPAMYKRDKNRSFNPTAPIYAGMKFLHWFDFSLSPEEDCILQCLQGEESDDDPMTPEEIKEQRHQSDLEEKGKADALIESVASGQRMARLKGNYHILLISGNNGRAMIRRYEHGSYETLQQNLRKWTDDISLMDDSGADYVRPCKFFSRLIRLVNQRNAENLLDQMKKELAGVTPAILMAIMNGTALPDTVAARALNYIRSGLFSDDEKKKVFLPDKIACQWLKAWLIRKRRSKNEEVFLMAYYDPDFPNAAYHCGAWLAVYAHLQSAAMGDVNASLAQRFYASASQTPALVFGTLSRMGTVYLDKLRKDKKVGIANKYEERLNDVCAFFGSEPSRQLPKMLNLEGQSYFALGYRQMCTQINAEIKEASDAKKAEKQEEK